MIRRLDALARGREVYLAEVTEPGGWPDELPAAPFVALTVLDASNHSVDQIATLAEKLLGGGCITTMSWGPGNERVHDIFDEVEVGDGNTASGPRFDTTWWFSDDTLDDALWSAINLGHTDGAPKPGIVILVEPRWLDDVTAAMADPDAFCTAVEDADADPAFASPRRSRRRRWPWVIAALVVAVVGYLYLPAIGHPSGETLNFALSKQIGSRTNTPGPCERISGATWRCEVWDSEESGTVAYTLVMSGRRCWTARQVPGSAYAAEGEPLATRASGCVRLRDQLR